MKLKLFYFYMIFFAPLVVLSQSIKPYLQAAKPTSIYVNWKTDNGNNPTVTYGVEPDNLLFTATGTTENLEPKDTDYSAPYHYHSVKLTDLSPNTGYYYQVFSGTEDASDVHYFKTPPALGDDTGVLRFIALGDHQIINYNGEPYYKYNQLVQAAKAKAEELYGAPLADHFNLIMNDGDQVDLGKLQHYEKIHFEKTSYITPDLPLITAVGNHEVYGGSYQNGPIQAYYDHFILDDEWTYGGINSGTERYYAYQLANVLFVVVDTELTNTTQLDWVDSVMDYASADDTVDWIISICHRPYEAEQYSNDYSSWFGNSVLPLLQGSDKYMLHMAGHHHLYARGQFKNHNGYHMISGGTAWPQYWGDSSNEDDREETQGTWSDFAFQLIEIDNTTNEMSVQSYTIGSLFSEKDSELLDEFHFKKDEALPNQPEITNTIEASIQLPYTLESSAFSTTTDYVLNSTQFQVSSTEDFSILNIDSFRHVDNYYGPGEANDVTVNIGEGDGILNYTIPEFYLNNGDFFARVRHRDDNLGWSTWSEPIAFTIEGSTDGDPLIYLDQNSYANNASIGLTFINGPGGNTDWIGIYSADTEPGDSPSTAWSYVNGQASGVKTFSIATSGIYYATFLINDGYEEITDRVYFWVGNIPTLSTDFEAYEVGADVTISFSNHPNNPTDWIGIYKVGDAIGEGNETLALTVETDLEEVLATGLDNAYYYAVYHVEGTYLTAGAPISFQIGEEIATISTVKTTFSVGEPITIEFMDGPGIEKDYIGVIIEDGTPAGTDNLWTYKYFGGLTAGSTTITGIDYVQGGPNQLPIVGTYYLAMFTNDSYTQVSNAIPITITADPAMYLDATIVNEGEAFDIHFVNAPGNSTDWLGIYFEGQSPGGPTSQDWSYINGEINGSRTFTLENGGNYFVALMENDSYNEVASRVEFIVRSTPVLSPTQTIFAGEEDVLIELVSGGMTNVEDWIGIYEAGSEPSPSTLVQSLSVNNAPGFYNMGTLEEGLYYATYHTEGSYEEVGTRANFQVGSVVIALGMDAIDYYIGDALTFTVSQASGNNQDYVAIFDSGENPEADVAYSFVNLGVVTEGSVIMDGSSSTPGSENYLPQEEGAYFAVVIDGITGGEISNRVSFTESAKPMATMETTQIGVGESLTVTYANGPGNSADWVGVYLVGQTPGNGAYSTTWEYVDANNFTDGTLTLSGINTEGSYFLALFENDGYTEVSDRFYFEVVNTLGVALQEKARHKVIIYPNPSIGIAYIKAQSEITQVEVYDSNGKLVNVQKQINQSTTTLNLKSFNRGMYIVKVEVNGAWVNQKLLLK